MMLDGWTNPKCRTLLNFLVNCSKGTMFIKYVDASTNIKDTILLCELLDRFIQEVGPHNVVQFITNNVVNYFVASMFLMPRILPCFGFLVLHIVLM